MNIKGITRKFTPLAIAGSLALGCATKEKPQATQDNSTKIAADAGAPRPAANDAAPAAAAPAKDVNSLTAWQTERLETFKKSLYDIDAPVTDKKKTCAQLENNLERLAFEGICKSPETANKDEATICKLQFTVHLATKNHMRALNCESNPSQSWGQAAAAQAPAGKAQAAPKKAPQQPSKADQCASLQAQVDRNVYYTMCTFEEYPFETDRKACNDKKDAQDAIAAKIKQFGCTR